MYKIFCLSAVIFLSACTTTTKTTTTKEVQDGAPTYAVNVDFIPDAVPKVEPHSKYGNPKSYEVFGVRYYVQESSKNYQQRGTASWYGTKFHKRRTSSGEPYDMFQMTAAHKTLPIPAYARVTNLKNKKTIIVKINDRGPFHEDRLIDLSYAAAKKLGITSTGTGYVEVTTIDPSEPTYVSTAENEKQLFLQVGAYSEKSNAEKIAARIKQITQHPTTILPFALNDKTLHRVQVGPFTNQKHSDELNEKLKNEGFSGGIVVSA